MIKSAACPDTRSWRRIDRSRICFGVLGLQLHLGVVIAEMCMCSIPQVLVMGMFTFNFFFLSIVILFHSYPCTLSICKNILLCYIRFFILGYFKRIILKKNDIYLNEILLFVCLFYCVLWKISGIHKNRICVPIIQL